MTTGDHRSCLWVTTEGLDLAPIGCYLGDLALILAERLDNARIITAAVVTPCCSTRDEPCPRDAWADDLDQPVALLRAAAEHHGIPWPEDVPAHHDRR